MVDAKIFEERWEGGVGCSFEVAFLSKRSMLESLNPVLM